MQQFTSFAIHHWELWVAFFVVLFVLIGLELRDKITGIQQKSPQECTFLINRENGIIIDVRDSADFAKGHILSAINIPLNNLQERVPTLEKYKTVPIIFVYGTGQSITKAANFLKSNGFEKIYALKGGISAWLNADLPLAKN